MVQVSEWNLQDEPRPKEVHFLTVKLNARRALSRGIQTIEEFSNGKNQVPQGPVRQHDFQ